MHSTPLHQCQHQWKYCLFVPSSMVTVVGFSFDKLGLHVVFLTKILWDCVLLSMFEYSFLFSLFLTYELYVEIGFHVVCHVEINMARLAISNVKFLKVCKNSVASAKQQNLAASSRPGYIANADHRIKTLSCEERNSRSSLNHI